MKKAAGRMPGASMLLPRSILQRQIKKNLSILPLLSMNLALHLPSLAFFPAGLPATTHFSLTSIFPMFGYGKMSGCAVAAMSALAEVHADGQMMSSHQIAASRNFSQALVGKVMTILSQHGLVLGSRGPGGGYRLAREPATITILEVVELFDGHRDASACPFGPGWCGVGEACPLHDTLVVMNETAASTLRGMTFAPFHDHPKRASTGIH